MNGGYADLIPGYYRDMPASIRANYEYDAFLHIRVAHGQPRLFQPRHYTHLIPRQ